MAWLLTRPLPAVLPRAGWLRRWVQPAVALALVLACGAFGVRRDPAAAGERPAGPQQAASAGGAAALVAAPPASVFFGPQHALLSPPVRALRRLPALQPRPLRPAASPGWATSIPAAPNALQPERARALFQLLEGSQRPASCCGWSAQDGRGRARPGAAGLPDRARRRARLAPLRRPGPRRRATSGASTLRPARPLDRLAGGRPGAERTPMDWQLLEVTARPAPAAGPG